MNLSFNSKLKPNVASVSPTRPESTKSTALSSEQILTENLKELSNSIEKKREELNKLYNDLTKADHPPTDETITIPTKPPQQQMTNTNILKQVHFEMKDLLSNGANNSQAQKMNSTFTVKLNATVGATSKPLASIGNRQDRSKSPKKPVKSPQALYPSVKPVLIAAKSRNLTLQQKRQLQLEATQKLQSELAIIREKVIRRKFAYIWLRKNRRVQLLPSQAE